mmetsp:Transcript_36308/g.79283  ORF Transcript_36308/g.79283 Transcript_36308/m.79283 type:complete len:210 (-) Transcript_36308:294-923(-)
MSTRVNSKEKASSTCGRPEGGTGEHKRSQSCPSQSALAKASLAELQRPRRLHDMDHTIGSGEKQGVKRGPESEGSTTVVVGRLKKATSWSLLRIVGGDRVDELCDYAFVPQDRLADGSLRNFRFGFVNFKDPAVAATLLSEGLGRRRYTVREAGIQGLELNIAKFWDKVEQRGMAGDFSEGCRPIVQTEAGWNPIPVPEQFQAFLHEEE